MLFLLFSNLWAYESTPQSLYFNDQIQVFDNVQYDSGWEPSSGSLQIRLQVVANGGAEVKMDGSAKLGWPDDLTMGIEPTPDSGLAILNSELETVISLRFDIGAFQWEGDLSVASIVFGSEERFDPYLLGETVTLSDDADGQRIVDYNISPIPGVDLIFEGVLTPVVDMTITGERWDVDGQDIFSLDDTASWSPEGKPALDLVSQYHANLEANLSMELSPVFRVCVPLLGCRDLELFEVPVATFEDEQSHAFPAIDVHFPLPLTHIGAEEHDFGSINVGDVSNWEVTVDNIGEHPLEMTAELEGDSDQFTLFPESMYANPATSDGLVLSYTPAEEGEHSVTLRLHSNDPSRPVIEIPVYGNAQLAQSDPVVDGEDNSKIVGGCGCNTKKASPSLLWIFGVFAFVLRRRE